MSKPLVLKFGADTSGAESSIKRLADSVTANLGAAAGGALVLSRGLVQVGAAGNGLNTVINILGLYKGALLATAAAAGLFGLAVDAAHDELKRLNDLAAGAEKAGVSTSFFATLAKQAETAKIKTEELADAVRNAREATREKSSGEVNGVGRQLDQAYRPGGLTNEGFSDRAVANGQAVGLGLYNQAASAEEKVRALIVAIRELQMEATRTGNIKLNLAADEIATSAFGAKGREIAEGIREGKIAADALGASIGDAGRTMDAEMVTRAKDLKDRIDESDRLMRDGLKPITDDLGRAAMAVSEGWASVSSTIKGALGYAGQLYVVAVNLSNVLQKNLPGFERGGASEQISAQFRELDRKVAVTDRLTEAETRLRKAEESTGSYRGDGKRLQALEAARDDAAENFRRYQATTISAGIRPEEQGAPFMAPVAGIPAPPVRPAMSVLENQKPEKAGGGGRDSAAQSYDERAEAVKRLTDYLEKQNRSLEVENRFVNQNTDAKAAALALARLSVTVTDEERAKIESLAIANHRLEESTKKAETAQREWNESLRSMGEELTGIVSGLASGTMTFSDAVKQLEKSLITMITKAALMGEGPLASMFGMKSTTEGQAGGLIGMLGGMFGGGKTGGGAGAGLGSFAGLFADGGSIPAGSWGIAGEAGAEIITGPATVTPASLLNAIPRQMSAPATPASNTMAMTIDVRGATGNEEIHRMVAAGVSAGLAQNNAVLDRTIGQRQAMNVGRRG